MHPILSKLEQHAASNPDRLAACDSTLMLDYTSFCAAARGLADRIASKSDQPHIGISAPTSTAGAVAIFACWYAGRVPVPLNFLLEPDAQRTVVKDADLHLVLTIKQFAPAVEPLGVQSLLLDGKTLAPGACGTPDAARHDLAALIYTSGTSGGPKGVRLTFENLVRNCESAIEHMRLAPDQVILNILPLFHCFGFTTMTVLPLTLGATVWFLPRFSPAAVVDTIARQGVSVFMAVASMYGVLAKLKSVEPDALNSLTLAISGGEPLSARVAQAFEQRFGKRIMEGYGLTETSPVVSANLPWADKPGTVGTAIPGVEVYAIDEQSTRLPANEEGELVIRGHCIMQGYHNQPELTDQVLQEGTLHTGDIGRVDADGFISITGRAKDMLIIAGENVFPSEIEAALLQHPAILEAAVIGKPDDLRGEVPIAFVELLDGASTSETELREFCRQHLPGYKVPRQVKIESDLPRGATGKILKRSLKST